MSEQAERVIALWVPDWPVHAYLSEHEEEGSINEHLTLALIAQHQVVACSQAARLAGVRVGLREREARSRCPDLEVHPHDPEVDVRRFAPVLAAIEQTIPGVEPLRPGLCAMRARGPARYFGSEEAAAATLVARMVELGFPESRVGVASGRFAAEQATRAFEADPGVDIPSPGVRIVRTEHTAAFLGPLSVARASSLDFADVLARLGIRTLGALAALPEDAVRERFGSAGIVAHRRARGLGAAHAAEVRSRDPEIELSVDCAFEPPLDGADQLAFACSSSAEAFTRGLIEHGLVCTELRVELTDDIGIRHERTWAHPSHFTTSDVVNRVRWQAATVPRDPDRGGSGIAEVRLTPIRTAHAASHEPGLWNTAPDERVHHHLSRVQSLVGHEGVGTGELTGGRLTAERQRLVPWGTRAETRRAPRSRVRLRDGPWPGRITGALPNTVFTQELSAELRDDSGAPVWPTEDDVLASHPARLSIDGKHLTAAIEAWSAPWPLHERWWAGGRAGYRMQVLLADGDAWLLRYEHGGSGQPHGPDTGTQDAPGSGRGPSGALDRASGKASGREAARGINPTGRWLVEAHYA
ncbi:DNA polymerase Y family protein [Leucobacter sp. W1038]|uniref:DNA polymerase Y family protein n=1 Tax=Leucobacter sp. W1038 TaxID=3438281 RepID=UPI003D98D353